MSEPLDPGPAPASAGQPKEVSEALQEFAARGDEPRAASPPPPRGEPKVAKEPAPEPAAPATRTSPYDHLLTIRGDVGPTQAIGLFLGGLTGLLLVWAILTAGGAVPKQFTQKVPGDGRVAIPDRFDPSDVEVVVDGASRDSAASTGGPPAKGTFRVLDQGGALVLELPPDQAGQEVTFGYDLGSSPIVSAFILPKPTQVLSAVIELVTGDAYKVQCPRKECPSRPGYVTLGSGAGAALEAYADARKGADPASITAPEVLCPGCQKPLAGADLPQPIVIAQPAHNFRHGLMASLWRTIVGFLLATAVCIPLGVLAGAFPPIKRLISPLEIAGGYCPPVALLPLVMVVAAILSDPDGAALKAPNANDAARIGFLVLITSFVLYPLVVKEVEAVDEIYVNTAYMLGATRGQVVLQVLFPVAKANIWEHLRVCYAIGWACILLAEFAVAKAPGEEGLGLFMEVMQRRHVMENYLAAVLAIVATGIVIDYVFRIVGRFLFPYREGR